jgi:hypothetical protein
MERLCMSDLGMIVEGQTEQAFVRDVLAPHLATFGVRAWARLPGRVHRHGGVPAWEEVRGDILRTLKERQGRYCTTMFDFYAMPHGWPGRRQASARPMNERGPSVETALSADLARHAGRDFDPTLFIPYVQMHEFEALLFSGVDILCMTLSPLCGRRKEDLAACFSRVLAEAGEPEAIDDRPQYAPSKRIQKEVPGYRKSLHGPIAANRIGLETICRTCQHFCSWLQRLESLGR